MCGIAAIVKSSGVSPEQIVRLTDELAHRGPMGAGVRLLDDGRVALGHRHLRILDPSDAGSQPMSDPDGCAVVVFNGFISNYRRLREEAAGKGFRFRSATDTEVILALYLEEGIEMLHRLQGMFAIVLHDLRLGVTYYARDPFGIKPLYLRALPDGVALASEAHALRGLGNNTLDRVAIVRSVLFMAPMGSSFGVREVRRVRPGEVGAIECKGRVHVLPWRLEIPTPPSVQPEPYSPTLEEGEAVLRETVRDHLASAQPMGICFSGGVDSSIVAKLSSEVSSQLMLYAVFSEHRHRAERLDDPIHIRAMSRVVGLPLVPVFPPEDLIEAFDEVVQHVGEPLSDPASIASLAIARRAAQDGVRVMLTGDGADEIFGGYRRYVVARYLLDCGGLTGRVLRRLGGFVHGDLKRVAALLRRPVDDRLCALPAVIDPNQLGSVFSRQFLSGMDEAELLEPMRLGRGHNSSTVRRAMDLDLHTFLPDRTLNYLDKTAMAVGIEGRVPYLQPSVLALGYRLRTRELVCGTATKVYLRRVFRRLLGPADGLAPKSGFGIPFHALLVRQQARVVERITDPAAPSREFWSKDVIAGLQAHRMPPPWTVLPGMMAVDAWMRQWAPS